jgi:hypothetical protein
MLKSAAILAVRRELLYGSYPALGKADARNEGGDAPLSPPYDPPSGDVNFIFYIQKVKIRQVDIKSALLKISYIRFNFYTSFLMQKTVQITTHKCEHSRYQHKYHHPTRFKTIV